MEQGGIGAPGRASRRGFTAYVPRLLDPLIIELFEQLPALFLVGPRATGKTTTARRYSRTVVRLDDPAQASAFEAAPDAVLRGLAEPVLLDEWQAAPTVLGAIKRAVDDDPRPGRYIVTGSAHAALSSELWPGTGRLVRVPMFPMTVRELTASAARAPFLDRVAEQDPSLLEPLRDPPDLRGYIELALRGGFPEPALRLSGRAARGWLESYAEQLVTHDVGTLGTSAGSGRMHRYLAALAASTAGVVENKTLYEAAGITKKTAKGYDTLLTRLFAVEELPAWSSNRLKRLVRSAKRYMIDPALAGAILGVDENAVLRDGDLTGRLLDTFVAAQLRAELPLGTSRPRLYHLRQEQGRREVDLIAEIAGRRVVGLEVKAHAAPRPDASRHLAWLRDELGDAFAAGLILHTGPRAYPLGDRILAVPIASVWA